MAEYAYRSLCPDDEVDGNTGFVLVRIGLEPGNLGSIRIESKVTYKTLGRAKTALEDVVKTHGLGPQWTFAVLSAKVWNQLDKFKPKAEE